MNNAVNHVTVWGNIGARKSYATKVSCMILSTGKNETSFRASRIAVAACCLACISVPATAADLQGSSVQDAYIAGQLTAILEREWKWPSGSYDLLVKDGIAYINTDRDGLSQSFPEVSTLGVRGLVDVHVELSAAKSETAPASQLLPRAYSFLGLTELTEAFPVGDLFSHLIADPKQPQLFASMRQYDIGTTESITLETNSVTVGAVGFGDTFGLYRRDGSTPGNGLQISISAGIFAQFNLDAQSDDLVNADYVVGFPVSYRHGHHSARLRLYHQSSHLGDEFLLNYQPERVNLSYEALELLYSYDWNAWRGYVGGEHIISIEPASFKNNSLHGGVEFRSGLGHNRRGQWLGGIDLKSYEEHDWHVDWSLKAGYEFNAASRAQRLRILAEAYKGFSPHGQFYNTRSDYFGIGFYFGY